MVPGMQQVNVYGVPCRARRGARAWRRWWRARSSTRRAWREKIAGSLAPFARPMFLRLRPEMEITGTFKLKKADLVKDGFDPDRINDPLYWFNPGRACYEPLDARGLCLDRGGAGETLKVRKISYLPAD